MIEPSEEGVRELYGPAVRDPGWHHCVPCAKAHPGYITSACEQWWNGAENRAVLLAGDPAPHSADDVLALRCLKHATIPPTILPPAKTECGLCMRAEGILVGRDMARANAGR